MATNKDAVVFNPATTNLSAYGLDLNNYDANMVAYIVEGEILNNIFGWVSKPIDDVKYLKSQGGSAIDKHMMHTVISALD